MPIKKMLHTNLVAVFLLLISLPSSGSASDLAFTDPFYKYDGDAPLSTIPPGTVLKKRNLTYKPAGFPVALDVIQILYRSNNSRDQPIANVTSVISGEFRSGKVISYQSAYDSLNPFDSPSAVISGNKDVTKILNLGPLVYTVESIPLSVLVKAGYTVIVPDTQGPTADFVSGPVYGMTTLDSIRAALTTTETGLNKDSRIVLVGYSGGGLGSAWAAALAPTYAPDVNDNLIGAAYGALPGNPINNLDYVNRSVVWAGVAPSAIVGLARGYDIDMTPYLSDLGISVFDDIKDQSITYSLPKYSGSNWRELFTPETLQAYDDFKRTGTISKRIGFLRMINQVNLGLRGAPTIPIFYMQGTVGVTHGTFSKMNGDGVMLAGDARSLVHKYCNSGTRVEYIETPSDHALTVVAWGAGMLSWTEKRFAGSPAPSNCSITKYLKGYPINEFTIEQ